MDWAGFGTVAISYCHNPVGALEGGGALAQGGRLHVARSGAVRASLHNAHISTTLWVVQHPVSLLACPVSPAAAADSWRGAAPSVSAM